VYCLTSCYFTSRFSYSSLFISLRTISFLDSPSLWKNTLNFFYHFLWLYFLSFLPIDHFFQNHLLFGEMLRFFICQDLKTLCKNLHPGFRGVILLVVLIDFCGFHLLWFYMVPLAHFIFLMNFWYESFSIGLGYFCLF
jgi:hypothetical protein